MARCQTRDNGRSCLLMDDGQVYEQACVHEHVHEVLMCAFHGSVALAGQSECAACFDGPASHQCPVVVRARAAR
jgi:hypothetical protein